MKKLLLVLALVICTLTNLWGQGEVSGKVTSSDDGTPLPGVNVLVIGTSLGIITDQNGTYKISVPENASLKFSFIGYVEQEVKVGGQNVIDIVLVADVTQLDEVVVTALGIERNVKALGYSVTEVKGEKLTKARTNNVGNALLGRVAGVNIVSPSTGSAGSSRVTIRGNSTLTGNNMPLYVVDGLPMDNSNFGQAGVWGGSDGGDGLASINPDDIASISVLKGAGASALYGARASNGVILITTKKGSKDGLNVEFNSNFVLQSIISRQDMQTEYGHGINGVKPATSLEGYNNGHSGWGAPLDGSPVYQFDGVQRPYSYTGDNFEKFYRTGTAFTNTLAVSGGNENQQVRFSISNLNDRAVQPNSGFKRTNVAYNHTAKFLKKLTVNSKAMYSHEDAYGRPGASDGYNGSVANGLWAMPATWDVDNLKGNPDKLGTIYAGQTNPGFTGIHGEELQPWSNPWIRNPYFAAYQFVNADVKDRVIGHAQLQYDITDFLYIRGRYGVDWQTRLNTNLRPYGTPFERPGAMSKNNYRILETNAEWILGFNKTFGDIGINAFVGGNAMRYSNQNFVLSASRFNIPFLYHISNGANQSAGHGYSTIGINSVFASAEFNYKNYLFLTGTARQDWYSTLPPETNSVLYPSIGASFAFSDAFSIPQWLSFGKLRTTWGQVGGGAPGAYATNLTYSLVGQGHNGVSLGRITQGSIPNPNLAPRTTSELEFGVDLRFLGNRLGLDLAVYNKKSTDDILNAQISEASGFGGSTINIGEIQNSGIELMLTGTPVTGPLTWDVSFNIAKNNSEILKLNEGIEVLGVDQIRDFAFIQHRVGLPYASIVGFTQLMANGQPVYTAAGVPVLDTSTPRVIGQGVHDVTGGLSNSFKYKNFDLSFLIDFKLGGDYYSGTNKALTEFGYHKQTLLGRQGELTVSGVTNTGSSANPVYEPITVNIPAAQLHTYWQGYAQLDDRFIRDASFSKLREVILGYTLPKSVLSRTPVKSVNISFVARNLLILYSDIENVDPEASYNVNNGQGLEYFTAPTARSYGFNLSATF